MPSIADIPDADDPPTGSSSSRPLPPPNATSDLSHRLAETSINADEIPDLDDIPDMDDGEEDAGGGMGVVEEEDDAAVSVELVRGDSSRRCVSLRGFHDKPLCEKWETDSSLLYRDPAGPTISSRSEPTTA